MRPEAVISSSAITRSLELALSCLKGGFRTTDDGCSGWYHYLDDPHPGVTASAVGLYSFQMAGSRFERTDEVLQYLIDQQIQSPDQAEGGWSVRTTNGFPILEATAWVVRALSRSDIGRLKVSDSLRSGAEWIERNQNTDFGWGSYRGQPSRLFHTALATLALQECGGNPEVTTNSQKWLIGAQNTHAPAWGPTAGAEPTVLHTSIALLALVKIPGALSTNSIRQCADWLLERLEPGVHVERSTTVEEYDVPYVTGGATTVFQNSLPHFAGPLAITALLAAGVDPLQAKIFQSVQAIIDTQLESGNWELPRSPTRQSIWAIWPFISALSALRVSVFATQHSTATILFPGCAIVQSEETNKKLTRRLLIRNSVFDWLRQRKVAVALLTIAALATAIPLILLLTRRISITDFVLTLILPVLLTTFHLTWERWNRTKGEH